MTMDKAGSVYLKSASSFRKLGIEVFGPAPPGWVSSIQQPTNPLLLDGSIRRINLAQLVRRPQVLVVGAL